MDGQHPFIPPPPFEGDPVEEPKTGFFARLAANRPVAAVLAWYVAACAANYFFAATVWDQPVMKKAFGMSPAVFAAVMAAFQFVFLAVTHGIARGLGGRGSFSAFFCVWFFLAGVESLAGALKMPALLGLVWLVMLGFRVRGIMTVHGLSLFPSLVSLGLSYFVGVALMFLCVLPLSFARALKTRAAKPPAPAASAPAAPASRAAPAPDVAGWTLRALDGGAFRFADSRGKPAVLNVWATWCGPCVAEMPSLQRMYDKVKGEGVQVFAVSTEDPETVRRFIERKGFSFPVYTAASLPQAFQSNGIPVTFLLAPDGRVVDSVLGATEWDSEDRVRKILALAETPAAPAAPDPIGLNPLRISSVGDGGFALQGSFEGVFQLRGNGLFVRADRMSIRVGDHMPYKGAWRVESVRVGLARNEKSAGWKIVQSALLADVQKTARAGEVLALAGAEALVPYTGENETLNMDMKAHWIVMEITGVPLEQPGARTGSSYAHSARDVLSSLFADR